MKRRIVPILGLVAALAAIALFADVWLMGTLWTATSAAYYVPDSGDLVSALLIALLIALLTVWTVVGLVLQPPRRSRLGQARRGMAMPGTAWPGVAGAPKTTAPQPQGRGAVIPPRSIA